MILRGLDRLNRWEEKLYSQPATNIVWAAVLGFFLHINIINHNRVWIVVLTVGILVDTIRCQRNFALKARE